MIKLTDLKQYTKLIIMSWMLVACTDSSLSPEEEIKTFIEQGQLAIENRQHGDLSDMVSDSYKDQQGLNRKQLLGMLRGYFFRHKNIHLLSKIDSIQLQSSNRAFVILYVAMAGKAINDIDTLSSLRAKVIRIELQLEKEDDWKLRQASWKEGKISDLI